jgi:hypothetical protein
MLYSVSSINKNIVILLLLILAQLGCAKVNKVPTSSPSCPSPTSLNSLTTGLLANYDGYCSAFSAPAKNPYAFWKDISSLGKDASLFGTAASAGWRGSGTTASPYFLNFDGVNSRMDTGLVFSNRRQFMFTSWIAPTSATASSVLFENGGGTGSGFVVQQASDGSGKIDFYVGSATNYNYSTAVLGDSPVGYWRLNDTSTTAVDLGSGGNNGTYMTTGGGTYTQNQPGPLTGSVSTTFTGGHSLGGYISIPTFNAVPTGPNSFSYEAWVKPTTNAATLGIIGYGTVSATNQFNGFRFNGSGGNSILSNYFWNNDLNILAFSPLAGSWHHVVATWDGSVRKMYVDGMLIGFDLSVRPNFDPVAGNFNIGFDNSVDQNYFQGSLSEVALYNYALTPSQIQSHLSAGICRTKTIFSNGKMNMLSGIFDLSSYLHLFVNGQEECKVKAPSGSIFASTRTGSVGATGASTRFWAGAVDNLKVYSSGTAANVLQNFNAESPYFRPTPVGNSVTQGLTLNLDAANAAGAQPYPPALCSGAGLTWVDLSPSNFFGSLLNFTSCDTSSGWNGSGTTTDPYVLNFDGATNYVQAMHIAAPQTVEVWMKTVNPRQQQILDDGTASGDFDFELGIYSPGGVSGGSSTIIPLTYGIYFTFFGNDIAEPYDAIQSGWHQIVLTWDGASTIQVYIDGQSPSSGYSFNGSSWVSSAQPITTAFQPFVNFVPLTIGRGSATLWGAAGSDFFNGSIAKVAFYNRPLSQAEVSQNCKALVSRFSGAFCH